MRNRGIAAAVFFTGILAASGGLLQGQWAEALGGTGNDSPSSILVAPDGGLVVSGASLYVGEAAGTNAWIWILKTDREGRPVWQHVWECYAQSDVLGRPSAVVAVQGGGYLYAATLVPRSGLGLNSYVFLARLGPDGALLWEKKYGFQGTGSAVEKFGIRDACSVADGGILAVGSVYTGSGDDRDLWAARFNREGRLIWQRRYIGPGREEGYSVKEEYDGTFYLGGRTLSFGAGGYDFWVINITGQGDVIWQKTYGGQGNDFLHSLDIVPGGGCILAGETSSFPLSDINAWVLKLDRTGAVEWQKSFGGAGIDGAEAVRMTADGGAVLVGGFFSGKAKDLFLLKIAAGGGTEWLKTFGENIGPYEFSQEVGQAVALLSGGGYAVVGTSDILGVVGQDLLLIEISPAWEQKICQFLKTGRIDSADTSGLSLPSAAVVSASQSALCEFAAAEDSSFAWSIRLVCPSKKKKPRR